MKINEVDPRNYDSDIDYYNALNAKPKQRSVGEPRLSPRQQDAEDEDAISQQRQAAAAKARKERETTWDNKQEGSAPNGQQYNSVYTINAPSKASADSEAYSFKDYHWGAKKVVDQEYKDLGDGRVELKLYVVDNHKYGLWRPWKDSPVYKEGVSEAEEDAFMSKLGGLKSWQVVIRNNYYNGKYSDYSGRYFYVLATSAEEAKQVVLDNADAILQDLLAMKSHNGKKILPRGKAVRITADRIGKIEDGTVAGRMSTTSYRKMYSPQGVMMVKLTNGAIEDVQGQEQGVAEGLDNTDDILQGLTSAYRTCVKHRDSYTNFGNIQTVYELLRDPLMKGDIAGYEKIHGYVAGKYPDAFDALMDEVSGEQGVAEGSDNIRSMIQQYEDMVELVYDLPPGRKKNIAIDKRDALEAQIEAMPGGSEALRKWARAYNDSFDEGVAEGKKKPHPQTWHDVDPKLGKAVDKMSQAEKVKKGYAHPDTLKKKGVAEGVEIVDQDSDLDQQVFTLNVDGKTVSFTYWDYENNFQNPDIKDIYQQAREQLGKKLSPEQIKSVARSVFKSFKQGVAEAAGLYGPFTVTINTGERPQSRTKTKKFRREDDAILWAQDWLEDFPQYSFATVEVTDPDGNVVWTTDESLEEGDVTRTPTGLIHRAKDKYGAGIKALCQKIYRAGDDEFEYFYNDSPIFAQYWDEYEGDLDSIIAEVDPAELQIMHDELESYVQQANLEEGFKNSYSVGDRVDSPMGTGTVVALSKNIDIDDKVKVKLDDPSKAGEDGKYKDTFVLTTSMLKHLPEESAKVKNPYAIGMAQAMKSTGDKPPLEKATIRKAHEIAKRVMKQD